MILVTDGSVTKAAAAASDTSETQPSSVAPSYACSRRRNDRERLAHEDDEDGKMRNEARTIVKAKSRMSKGKRKTLMRRRKKMSLRLGRGRRAAPDSGW